MESTQRQGKNLEAFAPNPRGRWEPLTAKNPLKQKTFAQKVLDHLLTILIKLFSGIFKLNKFEEKLK